MWFCLMVTSLHAFESGAMENGIEERAKLASTAGEEYSIMRVLLSTPTETYNSGE